jgi:hypothetical protein
MKRPLAVSIVAGFLFAATFIAWTVATAHLAVDNFVAARFLQVQMAATAFNNLPTTD